MSVSHYLSSLQIEREPFSTSPDPVFFYQSAQHKTALHRLEIAIRLKRGLSLILADVGMGKTTLSRALIQAFNQEQDEYLFHLILDPCFDSRSEFLAHLTKAFGIRPSFRHVIDYREAIEKYLFQKAVEEKKTVILIIDEGQKLTDAQLETLRTLLNYETNEYKLLQLVILGQLELLERIKKVHNFMDRVSLKYILEPLNEEETASLIDFRLRQAGYKEERKLFTPESIHAIHHFAQGHPRKITMLCHQAMERLIMDGYEMVSADLIDNIIVRERHWA